MENQVAYRIESFMPKHNNGAVQYSTVQCSAVKYSAVHAVQYSAVHAVLPRGDTSILSQPKRHLHTGKTYRKLYCTVLKYIQCSL